MAGEMASVNKVPISRLNELLSYDPESGVFTWKVATTRRVHAGDEAGCISKHRGLKLIGIDGTTYSALHIAWAMYFGEWSKQNLRTINGVASDTRISNIRTRAATNHKELTAQMARDRLVYSPDTGQIRWRVNAAANAKAGDSISGLSNGYLTVRIEGKTYGAHRIAWLIHTGSWPSGCIDHINGDRSDNRIANLRDATPAVNNQNQKKPHPTNKSGYLGVSKDKNSWVAQISVRNVTRRLGSFKSPELAHEAYLKAKRKLHEGCTI